MGKHVDQISLFRYLRRTDLVTSHFPSSGHDPTTYTALPKGCAHFATKLINMDPLRYSIIIINKV